MSANPNASGSARSSTSARLLGDPNRPRIRGTAASVTTAPAGIKISATIAEDRGAEHKRAQDPRHVGASTRRRDDHHEEDQRLDDHGAQVTQRELLEIGKERGRHRGHEEISEQRVPAGARDLDTSIPERAHDPGAGEHEYEGFGDRTVEHACPRDHAHEWHGSDRHDHDLPRARERQPGHDGHDHNPNDRPDGGGPAAGEHQVERGEDGHRELARAEPPAQFAIEQSPANSERRGDAPEQRRQRPERRAQPGQPEPRSGRRTGPRAVTRQPAGHPRSPARRSPLGLRSAITVSSTRWRPSGSRDAIGTRTSVRGSGAYSRAALHRPNLRSSRSGSASCPSMRTRRRPHVGTAAGQQRQLGTLEPEAHGRAHDTGLAMESERRVVAGDTRPRSFESQRGMRLLVQPDARHGRGRERAPQRHQIRSRGEVLVHQPKEGRGVARVRVHRPSRGPDHDRWHPGPFLARPVDAVDGPRGLIVDGVVAPDTGLAVPVVPAGPSTRTRRPRSAFGCRRTPP